MRGTCEWPGIIPGGSEGGEVGGVDWLYRRPCCVSSSSYQSCHPEELLCFPFIFPPWLNFASGTRKWKEVTHGWWWRRDVYCIRGRQQQHLWFSFSFLPFIYICIFKKKSYWPNLNGCSNLNHHWLPCCHIHLETFCSLIYTRRGSQSQSRVLAWMRGSLSHKASCAAAWPVHERFARSRHNPSMSR